MRALHVYVLGYVGLVLGAFVTLWRAGILDRVTWVSTTLAIVGALALAGILLALSKPR
jgi:hypothetical protein